MPFQEGKLGLGRGGRGGKQMRPAAMGIAICVATKSAENLEQF